MEEEEEERVESPASAESEDEEVRTHSLPDMKPDLQLITFAGRRGDRDEREECGNQDWSGKWLFKYLSKLLFSLPCFLRWMRLIRRFRSTPYQLRTQQGG